jgi:hypothetical protein
METEKNSESIFHCTQNVIIKTKGSATECCFVARIITGIEGRTKDLELPSRAKSRKYIQNPQVVAWTYSLASD